MSRVVGGKLITYTGSGDAMVPPHSVVATGLTPVDVAPTIRPPQAGVIGGGIHLPPPTDAYTVTGTTAAPPHLASLGQAFSFAQSHFPAGGGAVTITRKVLPSL